MCDYIKILVGGRECQMVNTILTNGMSIVSRSTTFSVLTIEFA